MKARTRRLASSRGFTLVELLIALSIVGALLAIAFGGLRVAIAAWGQGEDRAEFPARSARARSDACSSTDTTTGSSW